MLGKVSASRGSLLVRAGRHTKDFSCALPCREAAAVSVVKCNIIPTFH